MKELSSLQIERLKYRPKLPACLAAGINCLTMAEGCKTECVKDKEQIQELFKNTYGNPIVTFKTGANAGMSEKRNIGVILSGGQAPGGHNVIAGLY
ncbi:diphosphate--fructose-6-phosphate 1-phosphotransferase, partial [bacterium]|nr:diphosphate--fructose-6-phosphate 1-phosphotransferase [bacterium]